jgi:hypothetical protein
MNEIDKIQLQIAALLQARNYLLNQSPSDMVALADVTEKIIALNRTQSALTGNPTPLPLLTTVQEQNLQSAIQTLDKGVKQSKAASDILVAATALANVA